MTFEYWTPEEIESLLKLRKEGKLYKEISTTLGRTPKACGYKIELWVGVCHQN